MIMWQLNLKASERMRTYTSTIHQNSSKFNKTFIIMAMYAQIIYPLPFYRVLRVLHPEITGSLWQRVESFIEVVPVGGKHLETLYGGRRNTSRRVGWTSRTSRVKIIKYKEANTNEEKPTKQISTKNRTKYWNIKPQLLFLARLMNSIRIFCKEAMVSSLNQSRPWVPCQSPSCRKESALGQQHDILFCYWFALLDGCEKLYVNKNITWSSYWSCLNGDES